MHSRGLIFRKLVAENAPLQILGVINAYAAMLAESAGAKSLYLSGAGVANATFGIPDLGMTGLRDVVEESQKITDVTELPLLVDVDTGWGTTFNIARTVKLMEKAQVAAIHIEDQEIAKRCGHRPNKSIVSSIEMCDRIKSAVDAREDDNFVIMARTDAVASEGILQAISRTLAYVDSGADMIFAEALTTLDEYKYFVKEVKVPVLANITEFGKTPLFSKAELQSVGIGMILYPLSAFRAMSKAALTVFETILKEGSQKGVIDTMQTRQELYDVLGYLNYEKQLDELKGE